MERREVVVHAELNFRLETYLSPRDVEDQVKDLLGGLGLGGTIRVGAVDVE